MISQDMCTDYGQCTAREIKAYGPNNVSQLDITAVPALILKEHHICSSIAKYVIT